MRFLIRDFVIIFREHFLLFDRNITYVHLHGILNLHMYILYGIHLEAFQRLFTESILGIINHSLTPVPTGPIQIRDLFNFVVRGSTKILSKNEFVKCISFKKRFELINYRFLFILYYLYLCF